MAYDPPPLYIQPARTSTLAIISLIAGIVGLVAVPFIGSIAAVITGHMARREISESGGQLSGDGLATAGLITGYVGLGFLVLGLCLLLVWLVAFAGLFGIALRQTSYLAPHLFM
jgi:Domain of unknown function (DUF4190)